MTTDFRLFTLDSFPHVFVSKGLKFRFYPILLTAASTCKTPCIPGQQVSDNIMKRISAEIDILVRHPVYRGFLQQTRVRLPARVPLLRATPPLSRPLSCHLLS